MPVYSNCVCNFTLYHSHLHYHEHFTYSFPLNQFLHIVVTNHTTYTYLCPFITVNSTVPLSSILISPPALFLFLLMLKFPACFSEIHALLIFIAFYVKSLLLIMKRKLKLNIKLLKQNYYGKIQMMKAVIKLCVFHLRK